MCLASAQNQAGTKNKESNYVDDTGSRELRRSRQPVEPSVASQGTSQPAEPPQDMQQASEAEEAWQSTGTSPRTPPPQQQIPMQQLPPLPYESLLQFLQILGFSPPQNVHGHGLPTQSGGSGAAHQETEGGRHHSEDMRGQQHQYQGPHYGNFPYQNLWTGPLVNPTAINTVCYLIQKVSMAIIVVSIAIIFVSLQLLTPDSFLQNFTFLVMVAGLGLPLPAVLLGQVIYYILGLLHALDDLWLVGILTWATYKMMMKREMLIDQEYWRNWWVTLPVNQPNEH